MADQKINDSELNSLEYEDALKYDKRTFWQYYWALLKQNQLLYFFNKISILKIERAFYENYHKVYFEL